MSLFYLSKRDKKIYELKIKNILYYVEDEKVQTQALEILKAFELTISEGKLKRFIDGIIAKTKIDYFDKVDFIVKDILEEQIKKVNTKQLNSLVDTLNQVVSGNKKEINDLDIIFRGS